ncbi:MAG TPA: hypothetical protein VIU87_18875 [Mycobacterium sp.]
MVPRTVGPGNMPENGALWLQRTAGNRAAAGLLLQRAPNAFGTVKNLSPQGSLPDTEWNVKTRKAPVTELFAEIAALATADRIEGVAGTSRSSITTALRKDTDLKTGLNFVANLTSNGETGFVDSSGAYRGPTLPLDDAGVPTVAIILGPSAFAHDKAQALATMRHEMKHAEHFLLAISALKRWRAGKMKTTFDAWVTAQEKEPDRTLIRERIKGGTPNTELIAYTEGLVTSLNFLPAVPDPRLMVAGNFRWRSSNCCTPGPTFNCRRRPRTPSHSRGCAAIVATPCRPANAVRSSPGWTICWPMSVRRTFRPCTPAPTAATRQ